MLNEDQISDVPCTICGSAQKTVLYELRDHEYHTTEQTFPLNRCLDCGCFYLSPRPNDKSLSIIYPKNYLNFQVDNAKETLVRRVSNRIQAMRIKQTIQKYQANSSIRVLDVGCGDGFMLDRIREAFPDALTYGVEPSSHGASIAGRKHQVFNGRFEDYQITEPFDIIISSHVIEHISNPVLFLKKIGDGLTPGGISIIDTPNIDCFQYRLFGKHWGGFHSPRHWTLFTPHTLGNVAERADFEIIETLLLPINTFWIWSIHSLLYEKLWLRKFADTFFHTVDCVSKPSIYYFILLSLCELLERVTSPLGLGQIRCILKRV